MYSGTPTILITIDGNDSLLFVSCVCDVVRLVAQPCELSVGENPAPDKQTSYTLNGADNFEKEPSIIKL